VVILITVLLFFLKQSFQNKFMKNKNKLGFSLVELLVVISIIAALAAILMVNLIGARERAKDSQKIQAVTQIKNALRLFYNDTQGYPTSMSAVSLGVTLVSYIPNIGDTSFTYTQINSGEGFRITIPLESGAGNDDINSQLGCGITTPTDKVYAVCSN